MKTQIKRSDFLEEGKKSYYMLKSDNKILNFLASMLLSTIVFFIVEILFGMIAGMGLDVIYMITNFSEMNELFSSGSVDLTAFVSSITSWEYAAPIQLIAEVFMTILIILIARIYQKRKASTLGFVKKNAVSSYIIGMIAGLVIFSFAVLVCAIFGAVEVKLNPETLNVGLFILFFVGWLFQGMAEEVICRGFIMTTIARKNSLAVAILGNSLFFSAIHLGNSGISALALINLTLFGVLASLLFLRTENIWMVSALHSIWNMVQGNLYGILVSGGFTGPSIFTTTLVESKALINGGNFGLEGGLGVTITLTIGILLLMFCPGIKLKNKTNA